LFENPKTGKVWKIGQDVSCLSTELKITKGEAEALLGYGKDAGQILAVVKKNWKTYSKANSRTAYLRGILNNQAGKPAKPTEPKPLPAPLPTQKPAATGVQSRVDAMVRDAIHALGNDQYTVEEIGARATKDRGTYNKQKLQLHLASMIRRGKVHFDQGCDGVVRYGSLEAPSKAVAAPPTLAAAETPQIDQQDSGRRQWMN
jgi:hypothetical protein